LVSVYNIQIGNKTGLFLQLWVPHGAL